MVFTSLLVKLLVKLVKPIFGGTHTPVSRGIALSQRRASRLRYHGRVLNSAMHLDSHSITQSVGAYRPNIYQHLTLLFLRCLHFITGVCIQAQHDKFYNF